MSLEKPWSAPFEEAISRLKDEWQAEIRGATSKGTDTSHFLHDTGSFLYPVLAADVAGFRVDVTISPRPLCGRERSRTTAPRDGGLHLSIRVLADTPHSFLVAHRGSALLQHATHNASQLVESGDAAFDAHYSLAANPLTDVARLRKQGVLGTVPDLEPFEVLRVTASRIEWSQSIRNASQVSADSIKTFTTKILRLAKAVSS